MRQNACVSSRVEVRVQIANSITAPFNNGTWSYRDTINVSSYGPN